MEPLRPPTELLQSEKPVATVRLKLTVVAGPDFGKELRLDDGAYHIGKEPDLDLVLSDSAVSRDHLIAEVQGGAVSFKDNGSTNGSFFRGIRFSSMEARAGTVIRIGRSELQLLPVADPVPMRPSDKTRMGGLVGESLAMRQVFALLERAAKGDADVLLQGETGTGKDVAAEAVHAAGPRARKPFVVCDLAAMTATLIESELFGHVRGAFTGAVSDRPGAFERAHGGTVFLDEVGDLPLELQPRLLRALERRQIKRVGGDRYDTVDVRVIAATHKKLQDEVKAGRFREDLFHRLAVVTVVMPPLRERVDDLPLLIETILSREGHTREGEALLSPETRRLFADYDWPGNVRELRNVVERAVKLGTQPVVPASSGARKGGAAPASSSAADLPFKEAKDRLMAAFERDYLADLLKRCDGNVSMAARESGIGRAYLHRLLSKHGLARGDHSE